MTSVRQQVSNVSLDIPSEWARTDSVVFVKPADHDGFHSNILISGRPSGGLELKAAGQEARKGILKQGLPGLQFLGEVAMQLGSHPAIRLDFKHSAEAVVDGKQIKAPLRRGIIVAVVGDTIYEVTTAAHEESEQDWSDLNAVLKTLSLD